MSREQLLMPWASWPDCPCGCGVQGLKLLTKLLPGETEYHVVKCNCVRHRNKRNNKRGQAAHAQAHRNLGGEGFTPHHEEAARPYTREVVVMPESKTGSQIPKSFRAFIESVWFRHALFQSERAVPFGTSVVPGVVIDGRWLIADLKPKKGKL